MKSLGEINLNRVALVTGSTRGIGRAIAFELADAGIDIIINDEAFSQDGCDVEKIINNRGCRAKYIPTDVSDARQVEEMVSQIIEEYGRIDILVNNAGIVMDKKLVNMNSEQWEKVISVNLTGTFNCTKSVIVRMLEHQGGRIVNISSVVGEVGNIGQANYAASKGGVIAFTKTIAREYANRRILVNAIAPGFIETKMTGELSADVLDKILAKIPLGRLGRPTEIARIVRFLVSDDASYITGHVLNVNGGLHM